MLAGERPLSGMGFFLEHGPFEALQTFEDRRWHHLDSVQVLLCLLYVASREFISFPLNPDTRGRPAFKNAKLRRVRQFGGLCVFIALTMVATTSKILPLLVTCISFIQFLYPNHQVLIRPPFSSHCSQLFWYQQHGGARRCRPCRRRRSI